MLLNSAVAVVVMWMVEDGWRVMNGHAKRYAPRPHRVLRALGMFPGGWLGSGLYRSERVAVSTLPKPSHTEPFRRPSIYGPSRGSSGTHCSPPATAYVLCRFSFRPSPGERPAPLAPSACSGAVERAPIMVRRRSPS